jgi:hypothetical protein
MFRLNRAVQEGRGLKDIPGGPTVFEQAFYNSYTTGKNIWTDVVVK